MARKVRMAAIAAGIAVAGAAVPRDGLAAEGQGRWAYCGAPLVEPMPADQGDQPPGSVRIEADRARYDRAEGAYRFTGRPVLTRGNRRITADRMDYSDRTGTASATGDVVLREPGVAIEGERGRFRVNEEAGRMEGVRYRFSAGHLHGNASRLTLLAGDRSRYEDVSLTTCAPGDEIWWLNASTVTIDRRNRQGEAWNTWLSVGGVPVFYSPWLRFPVGSDRLTGLLAPSGGRTDAGGIQLSLPFYWNIAPQYDATLTPTLFTERGAMLGAEFRYLTPNAGGEVRGSYLPDDSVFGDDRWSIEQTHRFAAGPNFRGELHQERVSDTQFVTDFDADFDSGVERYLESRASAAWSQRDWSATVDAQDWQTIDPTIAPVNRPYARQPRLRLRYEPYTLPWLSYGLESEVTRFAHEADDLRDTGDRLDVTARVALPLETLGYFIEPAVAWRHTEYRLDRPDATAPEQPDRGLPIYSVDAGLFLERRTSLFERSLIQTLEPRLFYLQVPEREQSALPVFDTGRANLTYGQLFRANRFTGPDRVGDTRQLSVGLSSRLIDSRSGREYFSASAGQILYFEDREVTLSGTRETDSRSDYIGQLRLSPGGGFLAQLDGRLDPDDSGNRAWRGRVQYRGDGNRVLNLDYRADYVDGEATREVGGLSLALPVVRQWTLFGGWRYDFANRETENRFVGVQYEGCCTAVRLVTSEQLQPGPAGEAEFDRRVMIEFEFKGLGGVGDRLLGFLDSAIPGYRARGY